MFRLATIVAQKLLVLRICLDKVLDVLEFQERGVGSEKKIVVFLVEIMICMHIADDIAAATFDPAMDQGHMSAFSQYLVVMPIDGHKRLAIDDEVVNLVLVGKNVYALDGREHSQPVAIDIVTKPDIAIEPAFEANVALHKILAVPVGMVHPGFQRKSWFDAAMVEGSIVTRRLQVLLESLCLERRSEGQKQA